MPSVPTYCATCRRYRPTALRAVGAALLRYVPSVPTYCAAVVSCGLSGSSCTPFRVYRNTNAVLKSLCTQVWL